MFGIIIHVKFAKYLFAKKYIFLKRNDREKLAK